jgi:ppGpp synthetase/RelA/SpoT-type nucleotidyltranferase
MTSRTVEDRLREEYFDLLPEIRRTLEELEARVRYRVMPISVQLKRKFEQIVVKSRIKDCESAIGSLRRRLEGGTFDPELPGGYSLTTLKDLAGVRILVFPRSHIPEIDMVVRSEFPAWESDHEPHRERPDETMFFKYHGRCAASLKISCECQIVPRLLGLFWEVEHAAIYKPDPQLKGATKELAMQARVHEVERALAAFERDFEVLIGGKIADRR